MYSIAVVNWIVDGFRPLSDLSTSDDKSNRLFREREREREKAQKREAIRREFRKRTNESGRTDERTEKANSADEEALNK